MKKKRHINLILIWIWVIITIISFLVGLYVINIYQKNYDEDNIITNYDKYFVMITDDKDSSFWQSVYEGLRDAAKEDNVFVELLGDKLNREFSKTELMEIAINSKVDGIVVDADESDEMTQLIQEANEKNIPVVTVFGDNTKSSRLSYVGIGSYNLGREYGTQVLKLVKREQHSNVTVLVNSNKQDSSQNIILSGIRDAIATDKYKSKEIELNIVSIDDDSMFSTEEFIRNMFVHTKLPNIIVCLDELKTICVYQAVVDYNKVGQVDILGYYDSETILNAIDRSVISATISIDTKKMGRFCKEALMDYFAYGNTSQYYMTDIKLIDKNNISNYIGGEDETAN